MYVYSDLAQHQGCNIRLNKSYLSGVKRCFNINCSYSVVADSVTFDVRTHRLSTTSRWVVDTWAVFQGGKAVRNSSIMQPPQGLLRLLSDKEALGIHGHFGLIHLYGSLDSFCTETWQRQQHFEDTVWSMSWKYCYWLQLGNNI